MRKFLIWTLILLFPLTAPSWAAKKKKKSKASVSMVVSSKGKKGSKKSKKSAKKSKSKGKKSKKDSGFKTESEIDHKSVTIDLEGK